ncbi:hypothetical protein [uncultured Ruegeria sp.]|uniref:hypothetical protein n=1 Tax=uncultured Ruegeria sp. TaxID=259304 RepID=UPI0026307FB1|nr:hypothetical protein [uncultured Ruegeria sp.]
MRICIATSSDYVSDPWREDVWIKDALVEAGCTVEICDWMSDEDWLSFDAIFVSSAWNIPSAPQEFSDWLKSCEADQKKRFINDSALLELGNLKDGYWKVLGEAENGKLAEMLIPSLFALSADGDLAEFITDCREKWPDERLVFKPIISASSRNTFVFDTSATAQANDRARIITSVDALNEKLGPIWSDHRLRGLIAQPYMPGIEIGEMSATFVGRTLVGAVQKMPGFGPMPSSTLEQITDTAVLEALNDLGQRTITAITDHLSAPIRSRLDVIPHEDSLSILEFEMVDPSCNFTPLDQDSQKAAIKALADEIIKFAESQERVLVNS